MRGLDFLRSRAAQFGVAVLAAVAAATFRFWLTPFFADRNQLVMFYPAIMVSAWWGGFWPGVVATVVSAALDAYLFLEPLFTLRLTHHGDKLALAIFVGTGVVISVLNENLRRNAAREYGARAQAESARRGGRREPGERLLLGCGVARLAHADERNAGLGPHV